MASVLGDGSSGDVDAAVYIGSMHHERKTAPRRIPFGQPPDLGRAGFDGSD